ncbi:MFS transporter, partial [Streptomyces sp. SID6648]|nr:MFS transporter [Streptomyces sp. SID6648]
AGAASGLINTVQQMGNALGLGLVSVVFFGTMSDHLTPARIGPAYVDAFQNALGWVAGVLAAIFLLMFALPGRPARHGEGGGAEDRTEEKEPVLV